VKTLLVLRHAKAEGDSPSGSDFDRPLTDRGRQESAAVGRFLRNRRADAILASPAARVVETVEGALQGSGLDLAPAWDRRLYNARPEALLEAIRETDAAIGTLLIIAHNPGLQELIVDLAQDDRAGLRGQIGGSFQTAALAELSLSIDRWDDAAPGCGQIVSLVRPSDLDRAPADPE
jgi:phosphohistidine phosphatase